MYSALFLTKYVDYIFLPYYSMLIMSSAQAFSLGVLSARDFLHKIRSAIPYIYLFSLYWLSQVRLDSSIAPILFSMAGCLLFYQSKIVSLIEEKSTGFKKYYAAEMAGSIAGVFLWAQFTSALGFTGFVAIHIGVFLVTCLLEKQVGAKLKLLQAVLAVFVLALHAEPQPINNKRSRYELLKNGTVESFRWDPAGHVELIATNESPQYKIFSFEGGILRSAATKFDGDYARIKSLYLNSENFGTWNVDVVLPAYLLDGKIDNALLISTIGGQEILAAKAFGAKHIEAVDINSSAQKISMGLNPFNGNLYDESVHVQSLDGRKAVEISDKKFDLIQIYSTSNGAFMSALGGRLRPCSLVTVDALISYLNHLTENGILHFYLHNYRRERETVLAMVEKAGLKNAVLSISNDNLEKKQADFYVKKSGWTEAEMDKALKWLQKSDTKWDVLIDPLRGETEKGKTFGNSESEYIPGAATDDWPFIDYTKGVLGYVVVKPLLAIFVLSILGLLALTRNYRKNGFELDSHFFSLGLLFGFSQQLLLLCLQKIIGRPEWGLAFTLAESLIISIVVLFLPQKFFSKNVLILLFFGCALLGIFTNDNLYFAGTTVIVFLQSSMFTQKLYQQSDKFRWIWWTNGLGFVLGACLFYVVLSQAGLQKLFVLLSLSYALVALVTIKNPAYKAGPDNSNLGS
jgi:hypothetical protein